MMWVVMQAIEQGHLKTYRLMSAYPSLNHPNRGIHGHMLQRARRGLLPMRVTSWGLS
jgi:hypothetical protein